MSLGVTTTSAFAMTGSIVFGASRSFLRAGKKAVELYHLRAHRLQLDLARLLIALKETGLEIKVGSSKTTKIGGRCEITSHEVWRDTEGNVKARYVNEEKFFATFLLKTFPTEDEFKLPPKMPILVKMILALNFK